MSNANATRCYSYALEMAEMNSIVIHVTIPKYAAVTGKSSKCSLGISVIGSILYYLCVCVFVTLIIFIFLQPKKDRYTYTGQEKKHSSIQQLASSFTPPTSA